MSFSRNVRPNSHCYRLVGLCFALQLSLGCNADPNGPDAAVTGTVRLAGEPLAAAIVAFEPIAEQGRGSFGTTDADGRYELRFNSQRMGIHSGEYRVTINEANKSDDGSANKQGRILARYNTKSSLQMSVEPGSNTIDFDLETK